MKFIGIDVGVNGGISIIDEDRLLTTYTIPRVKTKVDLAALNDILADQGNSVYVCIEDVHSIFGSSAKSNFSFGRIAGVLLGMVVSQKLYRYELVQPKKWQKEIWTSQDMIKKPNGRTDTKATSLLAAKRIFPGYDFTPTERARKPHDGLYDSALIAEYCRRIYGKGY